VTRPSQHAADGIVDLYERHAGDYDRDRGRDLFERPWLDRFLARVVPGGAVLDVGCGMGEPIAAYVIAQGFHVVGCDSSPSLIALCRSRFPDHEWIVEDMRQLNLGRQFDGVIAWDSFFHLTAEDQRAMFPRFGAHARVGAPLMFTSGPRSGTAIGEYQGEPLHHSSLDPVEYRALLTGHGFAIEQCALEDPTCGRHSVWLAIVEIAKD